MIYYVATRENQTTLKWFCHTLGKELAGRIGFPTYDTIGTARRLPAGVYVFADLERLSVAELEAAGATWRALKAHGCRTLNDPLRSMRRYELLRTLHRNGVNDFDVYRLTEGRCPKRFPVFLRRENDHLGPISSLIGDAAALERAVAALPDRGVARDEILVTEFTDVSDDAGVFHKYGAFVVGDRIVPAHLDYSRNWSIKGEAGSALEEDDRAIEAERAYVAENPHADLLRPVFATAGIQYGRIDYAIVDGALRVFEINTNPSVIEFLDMGNDAWRLAAECFAATFVEAMAAMDDDGRSGDAVPVARSRRAAQSAWSARLSRLLHDALRLLGLLEQEASIVLTLRKLRYRMFGW